MANFHHPRFSEGVKKVKNIKEFEEDFEYRRQLSVENPNISDQGSVYTAPNELYP